MQEIDRQILLKYDLEMKSAIPFRDGFIIGTARGKKFLKRSANPPEKVLFIHGAKEHLYKNNFKNLDRYVCTAEGLPYTLHEGATYTLSEMIEGNECNFDFARDIAMASRLLAELHKASKGYVPPEGSVARDDLGKLPQYFSKRLEEIKKLKKVAKRGKSIFDYMFLEHVDYFYTLGEDSIQKISSGDYSLMAEAAKREGGFCHHDFTHHNLIMKSEVIHIVNFDYCCFELKTYDIANLIRRKMRKCNWDVKEAQNIINEYRKIEELGEKDFYMLKIMLQFPQKLWRVVNKYYNSKRSWSERSFVAKLQEVIDEKECHGKFMSRFEEIY